MCVRRLASWKIGCQGCRVVAALRACRAAAAQAAPRNLCGGGPAPHRRRPQHAAQVRLLQALLSLTVASFGEIK